MLVTDIEKNRQRDRLFGGRPVCARCRRPEQGCYCAHVRPIDTRTRLVLLQHPRERYVAIGTAHMASLCLTNSELHVGIDWSGDGPLARALSNPERPPILLYPGPGAIDIVASPPPGPVTLVVVDGTWAQTKKVVRSNPVLAALPRYAFVPPTPSEYRIRKEPNEESVATIEALVHALTALEGDPGRFAAMLAPFRAMIDYQLACQERHAAPRSRHARFRERPRRLHVPRALTDRPEAVVCVAAEASSWPYAERTEDRADELVHWAASRPVTGEVLSFVVAPRRELAPGTTAHTRLDEATLRSGGSVDDLLARWRAFVREDDVVCSWGRYETNLLVSSGGWLPEGQVDLRQVARAMGAAGSLADHHVRLACAHPRSAELLARVPGRAGHKLRALGDIVAFHTAAVAMERARVTPRPGAARARGRA
jgi:DTW domain-containing protein YfiP